MKNLISVFLLFLAFTNSVNAQNKTQHDYIVEAKKELTELIKVIDLDDSQLDLILGLLITKHETIDLQLKNKDEIIKNIFIKFESIVGEEKFKKTKKNKTLYKDLTN